MDESIERLARSAAADPEDQAAARRLDAALIRIDRRADVTERFRFKFQCARQWLDLAGTDRPGVKFCDGCQREVHAVSNVAALREAVSHGRCVAFPASQLASAFEGLSREKRLHSAKEVGSACVVGGGALPDVVAPEILELISRSVAERYRVAPVARRAGKLILAAARPDAVPLDDLRFATGQDVELVPASAAEVDALIARMPEFEDVLMGDICVDEPPPPSAAEVRRVARLQCAEGRKLALEGDAAGARAALERAVRADVNYPHAVLWLAALFGDLTPLQAFVADTRWPAPIARVLSRSARATDALAETERQPDAQLRRERLTELFGFLGAALDTRGATAEAQRLYERCVQQDVRNFVEFEWASARLAQAGPAPWVS